MIDDFRIPTKNELREAIDKAHEKERAELRTRLAAAVADRDAALGDLHSCPECGVNCKECDCFKERLAALRAELDHVTAERDELANRAREVTCVWCGHHFASTLRSQAEHLYEHAKTCGKHPVRIAESKLATAEARCGELEAALRPFAEAVKGVSNTDTVDGVFVSDETYMADYEMVWGKCLTIGDFRRAAAALATGGATQTQGATND